jgi:O-antigen/teichoic acid export membrane protein
VRTIINFASFLLSKAGAVAFFLVGVRAFILHAGPEAYGAINLVLVLYVYLWTADAGIGYAVNLRLGRLLARAGAVGAALTTAAIKKRAIRVIARAAPMYLAIGLLLVAVGVAGRATWSHALFGTESYATLIGWTALAGPGIMASALASAVLRAFDRLYVVNWTQFLLDAWRGSALIVLATADDPVNAAGFAFVAGATLRGVFDLVLMSRLVGWRWLVPEWSIRQFLLDVRIGSPTMGSLVIFAVAFSVDRIFVSHTLSLEAVATYSLAADLHTKAFFLLWAASSALYQLLISQHARKADPSKLVYLNVGAGVLVAVFYYVPLALFAEQILTLWIHADAGRAAAPVVRSMLPGSVAYVIASALDNAYLKTRGEVLGPMLVHAGMLAVLLLALAWLPARFGITGVGWAYSVANCALFAGIVALVWRSRHSRA